MSVKPTAKTQLNNALAWLCYLMFGSALVFSHVANASVNQTSFEQTIDYNAISSGTMFLKQPQGYQIGIISNSDYTVNVTGMMARITLKQSFENPSQQWAEAIYVFPLQDGVAVDDMQMRIGERIIKSEIKPRKQAKIIYQQAKQQGKKAALLEQERANLFTTSVANIPPGESIEIEISFLQQLHLQDSHFALRLPLTITPRYIPQQLKDQAEQQYQYDIEQQLQAQQLQPLAAQSGSGWALDNNQVIDASRITPPQEHKGAGQLVKINVYLNQGLQLDKISSQYHLITQQKDYNADNAYQISLLQQQVAMDRDFVLRWQLSDASMVRAALFTEQDDKYQYGLLMFMPPKIAASHNHIAKEMIYIIDTSGSMGGRSMEQAKQALAFALSQLTAADRFNVIEFDSSMRALYGTPQYATHANIQYGQRFVQSLQADGGTEMLPALNAAMHMPVLDNMLRQIVFITDGAIGNEQQLFLAINNSLADARLHTVGIGSAPNSYFMQRSAELGRGSYTYIGDINEVQTQMQTLLSRLNQPQLTDITIQWPTQPHGMFPNKVADVYMGQPLLVSVRWPVGETAAQHIEVSGKVAEQQWQQSLNTITGQPHSGIKTWWARQKIKQLEYQKLRTSSQSERQALVEDITLLALDNRLMSKYTSFVAVDHTPARAMQDILHQKNVANAMPHGSTLADSKTPNTNKLSATQMPLSIGQTATMSARHLQTGLLLLLICALWQLSLRCRDRFKRDHIDTSDNQQN
ncbi:marine proteobacterial sortase target protein [Thalassotalea sp. Y01]|uniref:marine proteobacterial sortase target protein n=1 Tax=Thalassotalea sp. Y01 TaxID=2729613 RepID=UPI00145F1F93|nr:marine proteobacterial sortase target protein [Thalassotalea sp. Y01]NMP15065.1 marine proteobacterial sortase target protein [Thalassotalea sp. Y01]